MECTSDEKVSSSCPAWPISDDIHAPAVDRRSRSCTAVVVVLVIVVLIVVVIVIVLRLMRMRMILRYIRFLTSILYSSSNDIPDIPADKIR